MKPILFDEQNIILSRPINMTDDECQPLPIYTDNRTCVSRWKGSWKDRILFLITGKVWVHVISGSTQPPVYIGMGYPFENAESKNESGTAP